jgi:hypothetical protein
MRGQRTTEIDPDLTSGFEILQKEGLVIGGNADSNCAP